MTTRPVLLWDVMSTLVTEPFFETMPAFFGLDLEGLLAIKDPDSWIDFEYGRIDEATYLSRFFSDGRPVDGEGLKKAMQDAYDWMPGVPELLAELSAAGYSMHALSNYSPWYRLIEDKLEISRYVAWDFVSCDIGHRKPEKEAYLHSARTLGVDPATCVFIDDRQVNVDAARDVGMQAILRTSNIQELRDALTRLGVGNGGPSKFGPR